MELGRTEERREKEHFYYRKIRYQIEFDISVGRRWKEGEERRTNKHSFTQK
jgi:hypothetical protein